MFQTAFLYVVLFIFFDCPKKTNPWPALKLWQAGKRKGTFSEVFRQPADHPEKIIMHKLTSFNVFFGTTQLKKMEK